MTLLSGLPSAGVGALLTLLIFHEVPSICSFVGIIASIALGFGVGAGARRPPGLAIVGHPSFQYSNMPSLHSAA